jgi:hypothetical protein
MKPGTEISCYSVSNYLNFGLNPTTWSTEQKEAYKYIYIYISVNNVPKYLR